MPSNNQQLAMIFQQMADVNQVTGGNRFKTIALEKGARVLKDFVKDVADVEPQDLLQVGGIGKGIAQKIEEFLKTGRVEEHREMIDKVPAGVLQLLDIPGLTPGRHRVRIRFHELQLPEQEVLVASAGEQVELRLALGAGAGLELAVRPPAAVHVCAPPRSGGTGGAAGLRVRSCLPLDAEGRVRTRLLPAGVHDVEVWAVGFHPVVLTVTVPAEGASSVAEVTLHPR